MVRARRITEKTGPGLASFEECLAVSMQLGEPLIPAFSPSEGEKEKLAGALIRLTIRALVQARGLMFPLPIGWGEGQGEG